MALTCAAAGQTPASNICPVGLLDLPLAANTTEDCVVLPLVNVFRKQPDFAHNGGGRLRALLLSEQEAMALLEVCLLSPASDDPLRAALFGKVAQVCREFVSEPSSAPGLAD